MSSSLKSLNWKKTLSPLNTSTFIRCVPFLGDNEFPKCGPPSPPLPSLPFSCTLALSPSFQTSLPYSPLFLSFLPTVSSFPSLLPTVHFSLSLLLRDPFSLLFLSLLSSTSFLPKPIPSFPSSRSHLPSFLHNISLPPFPSSRSIFFPTFQSFAIALGRVQPYPPSPYPTLPFTSSQTRTALPILTSPPFPSSSPIPSPFPAPKLFSISPYCLQGIIPFCLPYFHAT